jgi:uncharacterized repeat protein (TIGR04076 family)
MSVDDRMLRFMQKRLGYSDDEFERFKENPRNQDVMSKAALLMDKVIVLEVVEAHSCNSRHRVGDKFYFDGAGNLLTKQSPEKICVFSLGNAVSMIFTVSEMLYAGVDPNTMRFKRTNCFDVGLQCGGWGRIVLELSVQDRTQLDTAANG